jgi:hypothetical protein
MAEKRKKPKTKEVDGGKSFWDAPEIESITDKRRARAAANLDD